MHLLMLAMFLYGLTTIYVYLQFSDKIRTQLQEEELLSGSLHSSNFLVVFELIVLALSLFWFITIPWAMLRRRR
jgi:hypothetical protein